MSYGSHGAVIIPHILEFYCIAGNCQFLHDTTIYYLPPGLDTTIRWSPEEPDKIFMVFAITFGEPRDLATGEVVLTDEAGFWHRGSGMKLHWDPLVSSVLGVTYPHITLATKENPLEIRFVNRTNISIYIDISIWYFECDRRTFEELIKAVKGYINFYKLFEKIGTIEEIKNMLKEALR